LSEASEAWEWGEGDLCVSWKADDGGEGGFGIVGAGPWEGEGRGDKVGRGVWVGLSWVRGVESVESVYFEKQGGLEVSRCVVVWLLWLLHFWHCFG